jgi:hypothetical protein
MLFWGAIRVRGNGEMETGFRDESMREYCDAGTLATRWRVHRVSVSRAFKRYALPVYRFGPRIVRYRWSDAMRLEMMSIEPGCRSVERRPPSGP